MIAERRFAFGAFRFDGRTGRLWRDGVELKLTPRAVDGSDFYGRMRPRRP